MKEELNFRFEALGQNALTMASFAPKKQGDINYEGAICELSDRLSANRLDNNNERHLAPELKNIDDAQSILISQAATLDVIFNQLAQKSAANLDKYLGAGERYLRLALKAQAQCKTTLQALHDIKNPKSITITKQANIAGQQVVNNGVMNTVKTSSCSNKSENKNKKQANELNKIGRINHATLDNKSPRTTSTTDKKVAAVEELHRS